VIILSGNDFVDNVAEMGGAYIVFGDSALEISEPDDNTYSGNVPEDTEGGAKERTPEEPEGEPVEDLEGSEE